MTPVLVAVLLSLTPAPAPVRNPVAAEQLTSIEQTLRRCKETLGEYPGTTELQNCDFDAWNAARKLVAKSKGNRALETLWPELFGELVYYLAGGDALAMRVVVASEGTDFELKRVVILTGVKRSETKRKYSDHELLRLLREVRTDRTPPSARALFLRWKSIRSADCVAYPVADCSARLNAAFGGMIAVIIKDHKS